MQKQVVHSLVIVSCLSPSIANKRDVGVHYEKLFKSCQQRYIFFSSYTVVPFFIPQYYTMLKLFHDDIIIIRVRRTCNLSDLNT